MAHITLLSPEVAPAAPVLPLNVIELVLAIVPQQHRDRTPFRTLICVLPPQTVPLAFASALLDAFHDESVSNTQIQDALLRLFQDQGQIKLARLAMSVLRQVLLKEHFDSHVTMLELVCGSGSVPLLQHLLSIGTDFRVVGRQLALHAAAVGGHLDLVKWWTETGGLLLEKELDLASVIAAAKHGHVSLLEWWCRLDVWAELNFDNTTIVNEMIEHGQLDALKWWKANQFDFFVFHQSHWELASEHGHVDILKYACAQGLDLPTSLVGCIDRAASSGHVLVLEFWYQVSMECNPGLFNYTIDAMDNASCNGHVQVLDFFAKSGLELRFTGGALDMARSNDHVHVLEWWSKCGLMRALLSGRLPLIHGGGTKNLVMLASFGRLDCIDTASFTNADQETLEHVLSYACWSGQVEVLSKLKDHLGFLQGGNTDYEYLVYAMRQGQATTLQWCFRHLPHPRAFNWWQPHLVSALEDGHIAALEVVTCSVGRDVWMWPTKLSDYVGAAASDGCICSLKYLCELHPYSEWDNDTKSDAVIAAAWNGHVGVLEWLLNKGVDFTYIAETVLAGDGPIDMASEGGHVSVLQWWVANDLPFFFTELALWNAIKNKHKRVIRWWIRSGKVKGSMALQSLQSALDELD